MRICAEAASPARPAPTATTNATAAAPIAMPFTSARRLVCFAGFGTGHACQARLNAGGYLPVYFLEERCHDRVVVFRTKLLVHFGGGADVVGG